MHALRPLGPLGNKTEGASARLSAPVRKKAGGKPRARRAAGLALAAGGKPRARRAASPGYRAGRLNSHQASDKSLGNGHNVGVELRHADQFERRQCAAHLILRDLWDAAEPKPSNPESGSEPASAAAVKAEKDKKVLALINDAKAKAFMLVHMDEPFMQRYEVEKNFPTARSIWEDVQSRLGEQTLAHTRHGLAMFSALKKQPNEGIDAYFVRAETLAANLHGSSEQKSEAQICNAIMAGLDESYDSVLDSIIVNLKDGELKLSELKRNLLNKEARRGGPPDTSKQTGLALMAAGSFTRSGFGGRYSRGSLQKGKGGPQQRKPGKCHYCGKLGHYSAECRAKMADEAAQS